MKITQAIFSGSSQCLDDRPKARYPEFAFIGRSNVGKSSLINMLCSVKNLARTSQTPGKTLLINHFLINGSWYLVDLPGYGFAKISKKNQEKILKMILTYIGHSEELTHLFVLLDARHDVQKIDLDFISALIDADVPFSVIFTKSDKLGVNALKSHLAQNTSTLHSIPHPHSEEDALHVFASSAISGMGREQILDYIDSLLKKNN